MENKNSKGFATMEVLKLVFCLSPTLFEIYLEWPLKLWKRKCSVIEIPLDDETTLYTLCFADRVAQDQEDLTYMTRKLIEEYRNLGLEVNIEKMESMCIEGILQKINSEDGR